MVGGQPDKFETLANEVKLPERRQLRVRTISAMRRVLDQALKSHKRKPEDPKTKSRSNMPRAATTPISPSSAPS